jgi:hypothetical protein
MCPVVTNLHSWPLITAGIVRRKNGVSASHREILQSPNQSVESGRRSPKNRRVRSAINVDPLRHLVRGDIQPGQDSLRRLIFLFEEYDKQMLRIETTVRLSPRDLQRPLHKSHSGLGERVRA